MKFKDLKINDKFIFPDGRFIWEKINKCYAKSDVEFVERYVDPDLEVIVEGNIGIEWQQKLEKN